MARLIRVGGRGGSLGIRIYSRLVAEKGISRDKSRNAASHALPQQVRGDEPAGGVGADLDDVAGEQVAGVEPEGCLAGCVDEQVGEAAGGEEGFRRQLGPGGLAPGLVVVPGVFVRGVPPGGVDEGGEPAGEVARQCRAPGPASARGPAGRRTAG